MGYRYGYRLGDCNGAYRQIKKRFENIKEFEIVSVRGLGYKAVKKV